MGSFVFLICNKCEHTFDFEFTYGCMRTGKAEVVCPECDNEIQLIHAKTFHDGSAGIQIVGATRGLQVVFT